MLLNAHKTILRLSEINIYAEVLCMTMLRQILKIYVTKPTPDMFVFNDQVKYVKNTDNLQYVFYFTMTGMDKQVT